MLLQSQILCMRICMTLCMSMCMRHGFFPIAASKHQKLPEANTIADTLLDIVIIVGYGYSPEEIIALGGYSYKFKFSQHTPLMHAHAYAVGAPDIVII